MSLLAPAVTRRLVERFVRLPVPDAARGVTRILSKLQLRDRVQAVVLGYETGLVEPGAG